MPDDQLKQYIDRWLGDLTKTTSVRDVIAENSLFINVKFRNALRHYMKQLSTEQIASIIQTANYEYINLMFVMSEEDINDNPENRYECFGIVIPDDLLQQYINRWFDVSTKMYFQSVIDKNRLMINVKFRSALRTYIQQLTTENIAFIIQTADADFLNTMSVMTEEDINDNSVNRYECFCIPIPDQLLEQYIVKWLECLTKNLVFREFHQQMWTIHECNISDFINKMFVMAENDIKANAENRYECFGIVIPDDLLQQYIERWFEQLTKTSDIQKT
ncbi:unnamed protein product [Mytilus edulis]|uniref:Uncharacterized protein n=1 Tax=Mytilus edulis TaxID=6550 RepID=A0A8S3QQK2_MYTED|nr:unnamed protein product [Mytilus edulis]